VAELTFEEKVRNKFKIEKGVSRINRVKLQASIEESVGTQLALMCGWSNNDRNYVVNELLRFALSQDGEFQAYKESVATRSVDDRAVGLRRVCVRGGKAGAYCQSHLFPGPESF
jgi:hypothetical protein